MIEVERAGFLPLACLLVGRNATAVDWLALLKTSAEINAALCPLGAAFEVCHAAPDQTQLRCGKWRRVVRAARRYAYVVLHVAFMSRGVAGSDWESSESKGNRRDMPRHDGRQEWRLPRST
jgi:hypothetical protein